MYLAIILLNRFTYAAEEHKFSCQSLIKLLNALCQAANSQRFMQKQRYYHIGF